MRIPKLATLATLGLAVALAAPAAEGASRHAHPSKHRYDRRDGTPGRYYRHRGRTYVVPGYSQRYHYDRRYVGPYSAWYPRVYYAPPPVYYDYYGPLVPPPRSGFYLYLRF
jgi:hypothetical protein